MIQTSFRPISPVLAMTSAKDFVSRYVDSHTSKNNSKASVPHGAVIFAALRFNCTKSLLSSGGYSKNRAPTAREIGITLFQRKLGMWQRRRGPQLRPAVAKPHLLISTSKF